MVITASCCRGIFTTARQEEVIGESWIGVAIFNRRAAVWGALGAALAAVNTVRFELVSADAAAAAQNLLFLRTLDAALAAECGIRFENIATAAARMRIRVLVNAPIKNGRGVPSRDNKELPLEILELLVALRKLRLLQETLFR